MAHVASTALPPLLKIMAPAVAPSGLPVIATSEFRDQRDAFVAYGAIWLSKPWTPNELREEVLRQLPAAASPPRNSNSSAIEVRTMAPPAARLR